jgi:DNA-binding transcriptional regulator YiaG
MKLANIASALKEEITRLARKEIRGETEGLKKASAQYRSEIAALKRRVTSLEQQLSRIGKTVSKNVEAKAKPEGEPQARFTAKGFITLRKRLGLTAAEIGQLLAVSAQTIYNWEAGNSSPREKQLAHVVSLRKMGKREVAAALEKLAA